jgi:hypothetical protein
MDLLEFGSWGYRIGALGIVAFTVSFLMTVRWWSDLLGRVLAVVFTVMTVVFITSAYRTAHPIDTPSFLLWRTIVYWAYGAGIWGGLLTFLWFQFFAPRIKAGTTRRGNKDEEVHVAGSGPGGDDDPDDGAGRDV